MVLEKLISMAAERFGMEKMDLSANTTFEELNIDSLDMVELLMGIEDEFEITVDDEDVENFTTLGDVAQYISNKI